MRALAVICATALLAGCGSGSNPAIVVTNLPMACAGDSAALLKALRAAPGPVLVGGKPISECFKRNQSGDELQILGTGLLAAAQKLGDRARTGDEVAALELGYLIGAAQRGAKRSGLADELIRRLEAESVTGAAYDRGLRAGLSQG